MAKQGHIHTLVTLTKQVTKMVNKTALSCDGKLLAQLTSCDTAKQVFSKDEIMDTFITLT